MELITAIALLCQVTTSRPVFLKTIDQYQTKCQAEYLECWKSKKGINTPRKLMMCILEKANKK